MVEVRDEHSRSNPSMVTNKPDAHLNNQGQLYFEKEATNTAQSPTYILHTNGECTINRPVQIWGSGMTKAMMVEGVLENSKITIIIHVSLIGKFSLLTNFRSSHKNETTCIIH